MASIVGASRLAAILTLDIKPFVRNTEMAMSKLEKFRQTSQSLASTLGRGLGVAMGLVAASAVRVAAEFNKVESQLRAVGTGDNIDSIVANAKQLGIETMFTATEVLELGLELKKLGFNAEDTNSALTTAVKVSQVFGGSLKQVGTSIAETQRQFGNLRSFEEIGDIFAVAFQQSALDSTNLASALKNVGSVANIAGYSLEETVALLGLLANSGQKAGISGTRLKNVILNLGDEFGFTGDELSVLTAGSLDIAQIFEILHKRAGVAGAVISEMGLEFYNLVVRLEDANGALDAMNDGLEDQLFIQLEKNKNAVQSLGRTIGDGLTPYVTALATGLSGVAEDFEKSSAGTKRLTARFVALGVAIPILTAAISALVSGLVFAFSGPVGIAVLGLSTLASLFINAKLNAIEAAGAFDGLSQAIQTFNEVQAETGGDLTLRSLPQLEKQLEDTNKAIDRLFATASDQGFTSFLVGTGQSEFQAAEALAKEGAFLGAITTEEFAKALGDVNKAQLEYNDLKRIQADLEEAVLKKEELLAQEAQRRLEFAQKTGDTLIGQQESLAAIEKDSDKIKDNFKKAFAVFGEETNNFEKVAGIINQISSAKLTDIFSQGLPGNVSGLLASGDLDARINLAESLSDEFTKLAILASQKGLEGTAAALNKFADDFKAKLESLNLQQALEDATGKRNQADATTALLKDLGIYDLEQSLKKQLSAAKKELDDLLDTGSEDPRVVARLKELQEEIKALNLELNTAQAQKKLDALLNPDGAVTAEDAFAAATSAVSTEGFTSADELDKKARQLKTTFIGLYDLLNPTDPDAVSVGTQEALDRVLERYKTTIGELEKELNKNEFREAIKQLDQSDEILKIDKQLGLLDRDGARSAEIANLTSRIRLLATAPDGIDTGGYDDLIGRLRTLQEEAKQVQNAQALVSFFSQQVSFLGEAFVSAARDGADFWTTLKESFLNTFYALVAKLVTLIALYTVLAIVSGGTSAASGAAAEAIDGGFGTFLAEGLTGLDLRGAPVPSTRSASGGGGGGGGTVRVQGVVSGDNIVIMNKRGSHAFDRTFG